MDKTSLLALFDQDQRIEVEFPGLQREVTPTVVRQCDLSEGGEGTITYSSLTNANADTVIREQIAYFAGIGQDFEWKLYDYDTPPDLKDRLASYGFEIEDAEAIMVLDLEHAPAELWQPAPPAIQRITDPAKIADVVAVEEVVWGEDFSALGDYLKEGLAQHPDQLSIYVAYDAGRPVSAAWVLFRQTSQFASLWGGSTLPDFRKQGLYTALLAIRAQEARARQVRFMVVDASPMSRPILEKHGFTMIATSYPCHWKITREA